MKIEKGILSDNDKGREPAVSSSPSGDVEKNRLFQTLNEETPSERNYLKLLGIVVGGVILVGVAVFYFTLPGIGDEIRVSREAELAVRDHFLTKEKRTATDIKFYQCDGFYGARVGVETRTDLPNPLYRIANYTARVARTGDAWNVTAQPVTSPDADKPCQ